MFVHILQKVQAAPSGEPRGISAGLLPSETNLRLKAGFTYVRARLSALTTRVFGSELRHLQQGIVEADHIEVSGPHLSGLPPHCHPHRPLKATLELTRYVDPDGRPDQPTSQPFSDQCAAQTSADVCAATTPPMVSDSHLRFGHAPSQMPCPMEWTPPPDGIAMSQDGTERLVDHLMEEASTWRRLALSGSIWQSAAFRYTGRSPTGRQPFAGS